MRIQPTAILTCNNQKSLVVLAVLGLLSFPIWFPGDGSPRGTGLLCPRTHSPCICILNWSRLLRRHSTADEWCHWIQTKTKDWLFRDVVFNILYIMYKSASPIRHRKRKADLTTLIHRGQSRWIFSFSCPVLIGFFTLAWKKSAPWYVNDYKKNCMNLNKNLRLNVSEKFLTFWLMEGEKINCSPKRGI